MSEDNEKGWQSFWRDFWCIIVTFTVAVFLFQWCSGRLHVETSILRLLPKIEQNPFQEKAIERFVGNSSGSVIFLLGHPNKNSAIERGKALHKALLASDVFSEVSSGFGTTFERQIFELYFPYRYGLLSPEIEAILSSSDAGEKIVHRVATLLYSPASQPYSRLLSQDPLLLFPSFLSSLKAAVAGREIQDGMIVITHEKRFYVLLFASLKGDPMESTVQESFNAHVTPIVHNIKSECRECDIPWTGVIRFASAAAKEMKGEIEWIGTGSLLGVIALILLTFRSIRPLFVSLLATGIGTLQGVVLCEWYFSSLHLITFAFASTLTGVAADYSFHYLAHNRATHSTTRKNTVLHQILPGMTNGMLTTALGYIALYFTPFPGLQQMAVFSTIVVIGAYGTVVCWYPYLVPPSGKAKREPLLYQLALSYLHLWRNTRTRRFIAPPLFIVCGILSSMSLGLTTTDDIRILRSTPADVSFDEEKVRSIIQRADPARFILVEGKDEDEILEREKKVTSLLDKLVYEDALSGYESLSRFIPSTTAQLYGREKLFSTLVRNETTVRKSFDELGISSLTLDALFNDVHSADHTTLSLHEWISKFPVAALKSLWLGEIQGKIFSVITLNEVRNEEKLRQAIGVIKEVEYVDRVRDISNILQRYRFYGAIAVIAAYIVIFVAFIIRYGFSLSLRVMAPAVIAASSSLGVVALTGSSLNIMHLLSLLLVLSIGVDYAVYFAENEGEYEGTMFTIILSALGAIVAFGMLATSHTAVLHSIGIVAVTGLVFAFLLSPLAASQDERSMIEKSSH